MDILAGSTLPALHWPIRISRAAHLLEKPNQNSPDQTHRQREMRTGFAGRMSCAISGDCSRSVACV